MALEPTEFFNGLMSLVIMTLFMVVGVLTALKYREVKNKTYIWWGIGVFGQGLPWAGSGVSFVVFLVTGTPLELAPYLFIMSFWMAITLTFWMLTITELKFKEKQKVIILIYVIIGALFDTYLVYNLLTDPLVIGEFIDPPFDSNYHGIAMLFTLFVLASITISLILFIKDSLKSENPEVKLKARFLLIALITFFIGAFADGFVPITIASIVIVRILLIIAAFSYYIGWVMPESVKKIFIKK